jgi:hypothetical protein
MGRFAIRFWGVEAAVEWDDPALDREVRRLLLPIWADRPDLSPEAVFRLRAKISGEIELEGPAQDLSPWIRRDIVETLERRLHLYLASQTREVVFVHAGVVGWRGQAIVIPGHSYTGKSTLVQALVQAGASYLSDEYAIVDPQGLVHPFPRPISLREPEPRRISAQELGWEPGLASVPAGAVIVTGYQKGGLWSPQPISPGQAVMELLSNTVSAQAQPALAMTCLGALASAATCWQGERGEARETATLILERLG